MAKRDNSEELFPLVNSQGEVIGSATRGVCHSGSMLLHPVIHLHLFNSRGELYLQRRPDWKDIQPNRWDTAVGGHVDMGESSEDALRREAREELGIEGFEAHPIASYTFESSVEREYVESYYTVYDGEVIPSDELDGGRFWTLSDIESAIREGGVLTENFTSEFESYIRGLSTLR